MNYQITQWCAHFISEHVKEGDLCIDATMGNGNDTLLFSRLCGEKGHSTRFLTFRKWHLPIPESGLKRKMLPTIMNCFWIPT